MAMKVYSAFPKAPAILETYYVIAKCHIQAGESYLFAEI